MPPQQSVQEQIAADLRHKIMAGEYEPGDKLPSESRLTSQYGTARNTVRAAYLLLLQEGLVESRQGHSYSVRVYQPLDWWPGTFEHQASRRDTVEAGADAWAADVKAQGHEPRQEVDVSIVVPPPRVAAELKTPDGELVVVRRRRRFVDGALVQLADSYYPLEVANGTPIMTPGDVVIPGGLMAAAGHRQRRYVDDIISRMATRAEQVLMGLGAVTPMIEHLRVGYNVANQPVRVIITTAPGDKLRIRQEFTDPDVTE